MIIKYAADLHDLIVHAQTEAEGVRAQTESNLSESTANHLKELEELRGNLEKSKKEVLEELSKSHVGALDKVEKAAAGELAVKIDELENSRFRTVSLERVGTVMC